jgi:SAM-dependent methyltransferase
MLENVEKFLAEFAGALKDRTFVKMTLGNYKGADEHLQKLMLRPVKTRKGDRLFFQYRFDTRDVVKNHDLDEGVALVDEFLENGFFSAHLFTTARDFQLSIGKKGKSRLNTGKPTFKSVPDAAHDRQKKTLIDPGSFYLKALGITTDDGIVRDKQQDKWRQINKFVETLSNLFDNSGLKDKRGISIVDMGSGKGYLTFAAYEYFSRVRGLDVKIAGVDTRQEMIDLCSDIARTSDFEGLKFVHGTIEDYDIGQTDILIALHACDTATDDAIYKGIRAGADLIVTAPCCHKEVRPQIKPPAMLKDVLRHGIMLERTAETVTDGLRALLLEREGYSTKVFEFISTEHTPKNNMIAGIKGGKNSAEASKQIKELMNFYGVERQQLDRLLETANRKS